MSPNSVLAAEEFCEDDLESILSQRLELLNQVCQKYSNPMRGESAGLHSMPIDEPRCEKLKTILYLFSKNSNSGWLFGVPDTIYILSKVDNLSSTPFVQRFSWILFGHLGSFPT